MALAVCLLFDARSDLRIRELWSRVEAAGVPTLATHTHGRHHPHLSYAVLRDWDLERVQQALQLLPAAELHRSYRPGEWVPHVSVATRAPGDRLPVVVKAIADVLPLTVRVERAALIDSGTGQTWRLSHVL